jgi:transcriptional regulator with XRE-family HTH domain
MPYNCGEFVGGFNVTFGEKLKSLRDAVGLTQAQLADASGVPVGTIRDYEQIKRDPLLSSAAKLARALGVSIEVFAECVDKDESPSERKRPRGRPTKPLVEPETEAQHKSDKRKATIQTDPKKP